MKLVSLLAAAAATLPLFAPTQAFACACGCGVFDVGDGTITPMDTDTGLSVWARYAHVDQKHLREGCHSADPADNPDKRITTDFYTLGAEYTVNAHWTVAAQLPFYDRRFTTTDDGTWADAQGTVNARHVADLGDATVRATWSGLFSDRSTGLTLGLKLPTGRYTSPVGPLGGAGFDRDTLPGTGSTDLLIGGYHVGPVAGALSYFMQGQYQFAFATRDGYRPGNELNGALGVTYDLGEVAGSVRAAPSLSLLGSLRRHDTGINSDPINSGYQRLLLAPGLKLRLSHRLSVYGDVEFPLAQYANSDDPSSGVAGQLTAPVSFRLQLNYGF